VVVHAKDHNADFYIDQGMSIKEDSEVWVAVRPEKIVLSKTPAAESGPNQLKGKVHDIGYLGNTSTYRVELSNGKIPGRAVERQDRRCDVAQPDSPQVSPARGRLGG
jgi:putrescine transport system ATP-binding protein